jgi:hypothetical protein
MTWIPGGYNDWFSISLDGPVFELKINQRANKLYTNFNEAADIAANLLYQQWNDRPLYLAMSGGIDSEFVANTLHRNNIPFTPVILKIENYNTTESWYAEYWCYQHNIQPVILEYSMPMFFDAMVKFFSKLVKIKQDSQTPMMIVYDWISQQNGTCIYGAGDINLRDGKFYCNPLDFISNIIYNDRHPTSFFMYTAELALSYISNFDINLSEQYNKLQFYNVLARPKIDYSTYLNTNFEYSEQLKKLWYVFKLKENFDLYHWYGTKEQIVQSLQP